MLFDLRGFPKKSSKKMRLCPKPLHPSATSAATTSDTKAQSITFMSLLVP